MVSLVSLACDVGVMVNSVLILSPSRYCTTTTTTNSTRCGIYSVWFRVLSFGFWGVGVRWLIHLILSPSRYCTTTTTTTTTTTNNTTRCGISIYLYIYISIGRHIPGRIYISIGRWCNVIAHPPLRRSNGPVPCVSGVLSQHVAACRVETTLRGMVGAAYRVGWLAGGGSVRWGG